MPSVAQRFGTHSCSMKNRALARDILKESAVFCFINFRSKNTRPRLESALRRGGRYRTGRVLVRLKIALLLETTSKNRFLFSNRFSITKIQGLAFKVLFVEGSVTEPVAPPIFENCAPVRDILIFFRFSDFYNKHSKIELARETIRFFDVLNW